MSTSKHVHHASLMIDSAAGSVWLGASTLLSFVLVSEVDPDPELLDNVGVPMLFEDTDVLSVRLLVEDMAPLLDDRVALGLLLEVWAVLELLRKDWAVLELLRKDWAVLDLAPFRFVLTSLGALRNLGLCVRAIVDLLVEEDEPVPEY